MKLLKKILILLIFSSMTQAKAQAQDLSVHHWENRLLLILVKNDSVPQLEEQLEELRKYQNGLEERKMLIYTISPEHFKIGLQKKGEWQTEINLYKKYKTKGSSFEVVLIGLDGGTKLSQNKLLTAEKLFSKIDSMPMRAAEMRKDKKD